METREEIHCIRDCGSTAIARVYIILCLEASFKHRKRIIVAVYRRAKPYKIMSDCFSNTRKIRNARFILNRTNQSIFCTSSAPMSVSSALFCTAIAATTQRHRHCYAYFVRFPQNMFYDAFPALSLDLTVWFKSSVEQL